MFKNFLLKLYKTFSRSEAPYEHLAKVAIATDSQVAFDRSQAAIYTTGLFSLNMIETGANKHSGMLEAAITMPEPEVLEEKTIATNPCLVETKHVIDDQSILQGVVNLDEETVSSDVLLKHEHIKTEETPVIVEDVLPKLEIVHVNNDVQNIDDEEVIPDHLEFATDIFEPVSKVEKETKIEALEPEIITDTSNIIWEELEDEPEVKKASKKKVKKGKKDTSKNKTSKSKKEKKKAKKEASKKKEKIASKTKKSKLKLKNKSKKRKNKSVKKNQNTVGLTSFGNYQSSKFTSWVYELKPLKDSSFNETIEEKPSKKKPKKQKHKAVKASALKSITLKDDIASETLVNIFIAQGHNEKAIDMIDKLIIQQPKDTTRLTLLKQSLISK